MDFSNSFHPVTTVAFFLGGWCGSVPFSLIVWWILHHRRPTPPPPDPWLKINIFGALSGLVVGFVVNAALVDAAAVNSILILQSFVTGAVAGAIGAGFAAKGALNSFKN